MKEDISVLRYSSSNSIHINFDPVSFSPERKKIIKKKVYNIKQST